MSLLLDFKGRDTDFTFLQNAMTHWLSLSGVQNAIRAKKLFKQEDLQRLAESNLDKAFLAKLVRTLLFDKDCLRTITQAIVSSHEDESYADMLGQLRQLREELKELAKMSKIGLVAAGSSPSAPPAPPKEELKSPGGIILPP